MVRKLSQIQRYRNIEKKQARGRAILKEVKYKRSVAGRIGTGFSKFLNIARKGATRSLYERKMPPRVISSNQVRRTGKVGRPRGTVKYRDPQTGQPIGVFEYRKLLALRRYKEKIKAQEQSAFNPSNLERLRRIQQIDMAQRMSPENRTIPDTAGTIPLGGIMSEIDFSANLVP